MSRIKTLFESGKEKLLSVYFTAGYPKLEDTGQMITSLQNHGVDLIEVGFPFSDPLADGPVIQQSSKIALDNGMTLKLLFRQLEAIREEVHIPLILMGYMNPVLQYGPEKFLSSCNACGVEALILPDLPPEEYEAEYKPVFERYGIECIFLITPQTPELRIKKLANLTGSFIYMVSASSTTGFSMEKGGNTEAYFKWVQSMNLEKPVMIGFGVSDKSSFEQVCKYARGAIIGSSFINALKETTDLELTIKNFVSTFKSSGT